MDGGACGGEGLVGQIFGGENCCCCGLDVSLVDGSCCGRRTGTTSQRSRSFLGHYLPMSLARDYAEVDGFEVEATSFHGEVVRAFGTGTGTGGVEIEAVPYENDAEGDGESSVTEDDPTITWEDVADDDTDDDIGGDNDDSGRCPPPPPPGHVPRDCKRGDVRLPSHISELSNGRDGGGGGGNGNGNGGGSFHHRVRNEWIDAVFGSDFCPIVAVSSRASPEPAGGGGGTSSGDDPPRKRRLGVGNVDFGSPHVSHEVRLSLPIGDHHHDDRQHHHNQDGGKDEGARGETSCHHHHHHHHRRSNRENRHTSSMKLGMSITRLPLGVCVVSVDPNGEAASAGVLPGSVLLSINDMNVAGDPTHVTLERLWTYEGHFDRIPASTSASASAAGGGEDDDDDDGASEGSSLARSQQPLLGYPATLRFALRGKTYSALFLTKPPFGIEWGPCGDFALVSGVAPGSVAEAAGVSGGCLLASVAVEVGGDGRGRGGGFATTFRTTNHVGMAGVLRDVTSTSSSAAASAAAARRRGGGTEEDEAVAAAGAGAGAATAAGAGAKAGATVRLTLCYAPTASRTADGARRRRRRGRGGTADSSSSSPSRKSLGTGGEDGVSAIGGGSDGMRKKKARAVRTREEQRALVLERERRRKILGGESSSAAVAVASSSSADDIGGGGDRKVVTVTVSDVASLVAAGAPITSVTGGSDLPRLREDLERLHRRPQPRRNRGRRRRRGGRGMVTPPVGTERGADASSAEDGVAVVVALVGGPSSSSFFDPCPSPMPRGSAFLGSNWTAVDALRSLLRYHAAGYDEEEHARRLSSRSPSPASASTHNSGGGATCDVPAATTTAAEDEIVSLLAVGGGDGCYPPSPTMTTSPRRWSFASRDFLMQLLCLLCHHPVDGPASVNDGMGGGGIGIGETGGRRRRRRRDGGAEEALSSSPLSSSSSHGSLVVALSEILLDQSMECDELAVRLHHLISSFLGAMPSSSDWMGGGDVAHRPEDDATLVLQKLQRSLITRLSASAIATTTRGGSTHHSYISTDTSFNGPSSFSPTEAETISATKAARNGSSAAACEHTSAGGDDNGGIPHHYSCSNALGTRKGVSTAIPHSRGENREATATSSTVEGDREGVGSNVAAQSGNGRKTGRRSFARSLLSTTRFKMTRGVVPQQCAESSKMDLEHTDGSGGSRDGGDDGEHFVRGAGSSDTSSRSTSSAVNKHTVANIGRSGPRLRPPHDSSSSSIMLPSSGTNDCASKIRNRGSNGGSEVGGALAPPTSNSHPLMANYIPSITWFLGHLDQLCDRVEKTLCQSITQKVANLTLFDKERAVQKATGELREGLRRVNSIGLHGRDQTSTLQRDTRQQQPGNSKSRCKKNDEEEVVTMTPSDRPIFPMVNPIDTREIITGLDWNESFILPSAHSPILLSLNIGAQDRIDSTTLPRSHENGGSKKNKDCFAGEQQALETLYMTRVEVVALRWTHSNVDIGSLRGGGGRRGSGMVHQKHSGGCDFQFVVKGAVAGSVKESEHSLANNGRSNAEGTATYLWERGRNMTFRTVSSCGAPKTLSLQVSSIPIVSGDGNGGNTGQRSERAVERSDQNGNSQCSTVVGDCFVDLMPIWNRSRRSGHTSCSHHRPTSSDETLIPSVEQHVFPPESASSTVTCHSQLQTWIGEFDQHGNVIPAASLPQRFELELKVTTRLVPIQQPHSSLNNESLPSISLSSLNSWNLHCYSRKRMLLYKHGDDLRQEMAALQFLEMCHSLLCSSGLDLKLMTFRCLPVGGAKQRGFIEWVPGSVPLSRICETDEYVALLSHSEKGVKYGDDDQSLSGAQTARRSSSVDRHSSSADHFVDMKCEEKVCRNNFPDEGPFRNTCFQQNSGSNSDSRQYGGECPDSSKIHGGSGQRHRPRPSFWCKYQFLRSSVGSQRKDTSNNPIQDFLRSAAYDADAPYYIRKDVMDTYVKSCAGYCVATYLLGVGDRHLDNILLHTNGHLLHCDFSFILGQDPKTYIPVRITEEMVLGMGGRESDNYSKFVSLVGAAFIALRRHNNARVLLSLIRLVVPLGLPDVSIKQSPEDALLALRYRFRLDLSEDDALSFIEGLVESCISSKIWIAVDAIHSLGKKF